MEQLDREMDELDLNYADEFKNLADEIGVDMLGGQVPPAGAAADADAAE